MISTSFSAMQSPLSAMQTDAQKINESGHRVANINTPNMTPPVDLAEERVIQIETEKDFAANAEVIKTQDKMLGELIDLVT
ncbi:hypothetical protein AGMMS49938_08320 [Fibrobacterales bacterium]|nr:hypothetical protein AGMMS49938_08320 [Fibrobacterales bacterium]